MSGTFRCTCVHALTSPPLASRLCVPIHHSSSYLIRSSLDRIQHLTCYFMSSGSLHVPSLSPSLPLSPPQTPNGARVCSFLLPALLTITQAPVGLIASVLHRKDGTPPGHPVVHNFISVPLYMGEDSLRRGRGGRRGGRG